MLEPSQERLPYAYLIQDGTLSAKRNHDCHLQYCNLSPTVHCKHDVPNLLAVTHPHHVQPSVHTFGIVKTGFDLR